MRGQLRSGAVASGIRENGQVGAEHRGKGAPQYVGLGQAVTSRTRSERGTQTAQVDGEELASCDWDG